MRQLYVLMCIFVLSAVGVGQTIYTVGPPGSGYDYSTIQAGIDACSDGDAVFVYQGTYASYTFTENIDFNGKDILVKAPSGYARVAIDGGQNGAVVRIDSGEEYARLEGFTITNGTGETYNSTLCGGGIFVYGACVSIKDCMIDDNSATIAGGIFCLSVKTATRESIIKNCTFKNNTAQIFGGGRIGYEFELTLTNMQCEIDGCIFEYNESTTSDVGGLGIGGDMEHHVHDCIFRYNEANSKGGGLALYATTVDTLIEDCEIYGNRAWKMAGLYLANHCETFDVTRCDIYNNEATSHGGGLGLNCWIDNDDLKRMSNCRIYNNTAGVGGGGIACIEDAHDEFLFINNTIVNNHCGTDNLGGGFYSNSDDTFMQFRNCIFYNNSSGEEADESDVEDQIYYIDGIGDLNIDYCCIESWTSPPDHNINDDPDFTDSDYHIDSDSPCKDTGTDTGAPSIDFEGDTRTNTDIGADEYVSS